MTKTKYYPREISKQLVDALKEMPVVVLSGMRQTGKSTLLLNQPQLQHRRYFSFDDYNTLEAARRNPEAILRAGKHVTIDEAQKVPDILSAIKLEVDRDRRPGQFILSGSANFLLLKKIAETLAGRAVYLTLYPFTRREISETTDRTPALIHLLETGLLPERTAAGLAWAEILKGGMPAICLGQVKNTAIWYRGYEQTYLERDIRSLSQVADLVSFRHLLQLLALRNAQVLKQSELARDAKLNAMMTMRYLGLMETSFVIRRIPPFLGNPTSRLIKSPKLYLSDTGLAAYLMGIRGSSSATPLMGSLLENYFIQNADSVISAHDASVKTYYWNIQGRYEVDFVFEAAPDTVIAVEIKNSSRWRESDLTSLRSFVSSTKQCRAAVLGYMGTQTYRISDRIWVAPISLLLS